MVILIPIKPKETNLEGEDGGFHAFFNKNNEAQICPKVKNKLRTIEARLQIQM